MKKRQEGILTVEASISLTIYLFAMMFLVNFGQVYRAQNYMAHGLMQTGQMLAFSSYEYGTDTTVSKLGDGFMRVITSLFSLVGGSSNSSMLDESNIKLAWKDGRYPEAAKTAFGYCAGKDTVTTNKYLKQYGISGGIDSIDFSKTTCLNGKDLCIRVQYRVDLPFAFFNFSYIDMHQQIVCGLWE